MKVFNTINNMIKIVFILLLAVYFGLICKTKSICGHSFAIVVGNSMYPTLKDGDFLVVNQNSDYEINDIICFFDKDNRRIVHRIIDINENTITTKGDFNKVSDKPIAENQVIGKVVYKSTFLGIIFRNLHIVLICLCVFIYYFTTKYIFVKNYFLSS